jgi:hypothetical protein
MKVNVDLLECKNDSYKKYDLQKLGIMINIGNNVKSANIYINECDNKCDNIQTDLNNMKKEVKEIKCELEQIKKHCKITKIKKFNYHDYYNPCPCHN